MNIDTKKSWMIRGGILVFIALLGALWLAYHYLSQKEEGVKEKLQPIGVQLLKEERIESSMLLITPSGSLGIAMTSSSRIIEFPKPDQYNPNPKPRVFSIQKIKLQGINEEVYAPKESLEAFQNADFTKELKAIYKTREAWMKAATPFYFQKNGRLYAGLFPNLLKALKNKAIFPEALLIQKGEWVFPNWSTPTQ